MNTFPAKEQGQKCIEWIKDWFTNKSGNAKGIIIGISGGKDSTVVAALTAQAIGKDKVLGVLMPNGMQKDLEDGKSICKHLDINYTIVNIQDSYEAIIKQIEKNESNQPFDLSAQPKINIAPRLRMITLYAMGQQLNYRVVGTGNLSERTVGYATKWGDMACDFNPIGSFTSQEVVAIGESLSLPKDLIFKAPADGLSGKTDEENLGFTYETLNRYIRTGVCEDEAAKEKIDRLKLYNQHKINSIEIFPYDPSR